MEGRDEHHGIVVAAGCVEVELAELVHAGLKSIAAEVGVPLHRSRLANTENDSAMALCCTPAGTGFDHPQW